MKPEARHRHSCVTDAARDSSDEHRARAFDHSQGVPSTAAIAGHPLHPIVVPFPIAYLVGALATDLAAW